MTGLPRLPFPSMLPPLRKFVRGLWMIALVLVACAVLLIAARLQAEQDAPSHAIAATAALQLPTVRSPEGIDQFQTHTTRLASAHARAALLGELVLLPDQF